MSDEPVSIATVLSVLTAGLGGYGAVGFLLVRAMPTQRTATILHGLGAAAVLLLLLGAGVLSATPAPGRGPDFLAISFWLLVPAAALGLAALASRRAGRGLRGLLIGAHACVAVFGVTVLLAAAAF